MKEFFFQKFKKFTAGYTQSVDFSKAPLVRDNIALPKFTAGYTIIETMISISLFMVIILAGMSALLNASAVHQKSQDVRSIIDSLSFIMEDISRNIRTGYGYRCFVTGDTIPSITSALMSAPKSCATGWAIAFESDTGNTENHDDQWVYYINNGNIYKATAGPYAVENFTQMNPPEVVIESASSFSVLGAEAPLGDLQQPLIIIKLSGTITFKNVVTPFILQTSVSQRFIDV